MIRRKIMDLSLKIRQINKFNEYILQDVKTKKTHRLILEFYGINPKLGDIILLNEKLLDPKSDLYVQSYAFEKLNEIENNFDETDLAGLMSNDKKYILKRMYG